MCQKVNGEVIAHSGKNLVGLLSGSFRDRGARG